MQRLRFLLDWVAGLLKRRSAGGAPFPHPELLSPSRLSARHAREFSRDRFLLIGLATYLIVSGQAASGEPSSLPNIGPSDSTLYCQARVHDDYVNGTVDAIDKPSG